MNGLSRKRIFGIGRVVLDHVVVVPEFPRCDTKCLVSRHWKQVGGPVPVALSTAAHYGTDCVYLGQWGEDAAGREIGEVLRGRGVELSLCKPSGTSGFAQIWTEQSTGKRTIAACPGDDVTENAMRACEATLEECQIFHTDGSSPAATLLAAKRMKDQGGMVVLDAGSRKPGMDSLFPLVDLLIASNLFCQSWFGDQDVAVEKLQSLVESAVVKTKGEQGAAYFDGSRVLNVPGIPTNAVDTNGAGDIFCGGMLVGLSQNWQLERTLEFANQIAAYACKFRGNSTLPTVTSM